MQTAVSEHIRMNCHLPFGGPRRPSLLREGWRWIAPLFCLLAGMGIRFDPASAQDLGSSTSRTPYDSYLGSMRSVLSDLGNRKPEMPEVKSLVRTGRSFRYYMKDPYVPQAPQETEASKSGDCKAKSLWVAYKMDDRSVRYVVGKARAVSKINHAWLLWRGPNGWWVLDPTNYSSPLEATRLGQNEFVAFYSYSASGKYVHGGASKPKQTTTYADHM